MRIELDKIPKDGCSRNVNDYYHPSLISSGCLCTPCFRGKEKGEKYHPLAPRLEKRCSQIWHAYKNLSIIKQVINRYLRKPIVVGLGNVVEE